MIKSSFIARETHRGHCNNHFLSSRLRSMFSFFLSLRKTDDEIKAFFLSSTVKAYHMFLPTLHASSSSLFLAPFRHFKLSSHILKCQACVTLLAEAGMSGQVSATRMTSVYPRAAPVTAPPTSHPLRREPQRRPLTLYPMTM